MLNSWSGPSAAIIHSLNAINFTLIQAMKVSLRREFEWSTLFSLVYLMLSSYLILSYFPSFPDARHEAELQTRGPSECIHQ